MIGSLVAGRYRIDSVLGAGGMGTVYKAHHELLGRAVAIKMLKLQVGDDEVDRLRRFNQEARVISVLNHPNIITAFDFGVDDGKAFLVLEFVQGRCLDDILVKDGRMSWSRAVDIFIQISEALGYAHSKDIIHRDIKPSNVMLTVNSGGVEQVKLLDFGVAKILHPKPEPGLPITKTGLVFGSPPYMSPEQCSGSPPDARSDIYSLGCVMYESLSALQPISGDNSLEILHKQIIATPLKFHELQPALAVPKGLEAIVFRALDKNPETRYQTMFELRDDLAKLREDPDYTPRIPAPALIDSRFAPPAGYKSQVAGIALILTTVSLVAFFSPKDVLGRWRDVQSKRVSKTFQSPEDERALSQAVLTLARTLESSGKGKQAEAELKALLQREEQTLPADDPAIQDLLRIEAALEAKDAGGGVKLEPAKPQ